MARRTEEVEETVEATEEVASVAKGKKDEATVVYPGGQRTYSKDVHGDGFRDLAKEFAEKREGSVM